MALSDKFLYQGIPLSTLLQAGTYGTYPESKYKDSSTTAKGIQGVNGASNPSISLEMSKYFHYAGQSTTYFLTKDGANFFPTFSNTITTLINTAYNNVAVTPFYLYCSTTGGNTFNICNSSGVDMVSFTTTKTRIIAFIQAAGGGGGQGRGWDLINFATGGGGGSGAHAVIYLNIDIIRKNPECIMFALAGKGHGANNAIPETGRTDGGDVELVGASFNKTTKQIVSGTWVDILTVGGGYYGGNAYADYTSGGSPYNITSGSGGGGGIIKVDHLSTYLSSWILGEDTSMDGTSSTTGRYGAYGWGQNGSNGDSGNTATLYPRMLIADNASYQIQSSSIQGQGRASGGNSIFARGGTLQATNRGTDAGGYGAGGGGGDASIYATHEGGDGGGSCVILWY